MASQRSVRWSQKVHTVSTFPPKGTFTTKGEEIAKIMSSPDVSPKGIGSAIRMIQFFINRGGRNISPSQKTELEKAKTILQKESRNG